MGEKKVPFMAKVMNSCHFFENFPKHLRSDQALTLLTLMNFLYFSITSVNVFVIFQSRGCFDTGYTLQISETVKRNSLVHI